MCFILHVSVVVLLYCCIVVFSNIECITLGLSWYIDIGSYFSNMLYMYYCYTHNSNNTVQFISLFKYSYLLEVVHWKSTQASIRAPHTEVQQIFFSREKLHE